MPRARIIKATNLRLFLLNLILKSKYLKVTLTKRTKYHSLFLSIFLLIPKVRDCILPMYLLYF